VTTPLRIALAQVNTTVGDLSGNRGRIVDRVSRAAASGAHLVAFPELAVTGAPVEDLALRDSFVSASTSALTATAKQLADDGLGDIAVIVGYLGSAPPVAPQSPPGTDPTGAPPDAPRALSAAAWLHAGRVVATASRRHWPRSGVFTEEHRFAAGTGAARVRLQGVDVAFMLGADLDGPARPEDEAAPGLLIVLDSAPYVRGTANASLERLARRARDLDSAIAYVNLTGGQDELVFDGGSAVVDAEGRLRGRAPRFAEHLLLTDLAPRAGSESRERPAPAGDPVRPAARTDDIAPALDEHAEIYAALVTGTRDFVRKRHFRTVALGLSGGVDSALVATIAADALGASNVHAVLMPSRYSSEHSVQDADDLIRRQGLHRHYLPINELVEAFEKHLELHDEAAENIQVRIRGNILMSLANEYGHIVLTTGNKSELATGNTTIYGDAAGGFDPIKDVSKTLVWALCTWRNAEAERQGTTPPIPPSVIEKAPSAELKPHQFDTDRMPEYQTLDPFLTDYVERNHGWTALVGAGHHPDMIEQVTPMVDYAEYKRRQYPPGPSITGRSFAHDRRMPIVNWWREKPSQP
jgi:NAD+ synthase (glutamine-hydrolysing)